MSVNKNPGTAPALSSKPAPAPKSEPVEVTDRPVAGAGNGVYKVTVKVDDRQPGSSIVRTIQPHFALQTE